MSKTSEIPKGRLIRPAKPTVMIGLTAYRTIEQKTVQSLFNSLGTLDYPFNMVTHTSANVWKGRNVIVENFLASPADYLVFIDADMVFTPKDLDTLITAAKDTPDAGVIGGFYVSRDDKMRPLISWVDENRIQRPTDYCIKKLLESRGKLVEADLIPTGFMLIKRFVLEEIQPPWFVVETIQDEDGEFHSFSSDNVFVRKAQEAGFKTYGHFGIELGHIGNFVYHPAHVWPQLEAYGRMSEIHDIKLGLGEQYGYNSKEYWDGLYAAENSLNRVRDYPTLHQVLLPGIQKDWDVVDVGSGPGVLAEKVAKVARNCDCLDLSDTAVGYCEAKGLAAQQWDIVNDDVPEDLLAAYDCATCTEVIEHLEDPQAAVDKLFQLVKPGGMIMVTVPDNRLPPEEEPEHVQVFTAASFASLFKAFDQVFVEPVAGYLVAVGARPDEA